MEEAISNARGPTTIRKQDRRLAGVMSYICIQKQCFRQKYQPTACSKACSTAGIEHPKTASGIRWNGISVALRMILIMQEKLLMAIKARFQAGQMALASAI